MKTAFKEGRFFLFGSGGIAALFGSGLILWPSALLWIGFFTGSIVLLLLFCFFRDPERTIPEDHSVILSPSDGSVVEITNLDNAPYCDGSVYKISIFLSLVDVHVNRIPIRGRVDFLKYHQGRFYPAFLKKASGLNEQMWIGIQSPLGKILVKQVAGSLARRIVCRLELEQTVQSGTRFGMIKFGSRVEMYFPDSLKVCVQKGDHVKAGETILAGSS